MGLFDTVHTGTEHAQTKALGQSLSNYIPGDRAWLVVSPGYVYQDGESGRRLEIENFCVTGVLETDSRSEQQHWIWIVIRDGLIREMVETPPADLPLFGYHGQYQAGPEPQFPLAMAKEADLPWTDPRQHDYDPETGPYASSDPRNCGICELALRRR